MCGRAMVARVGVKSGLGFRTSAHPHVPHPHYTRSRCRWNHWSLIHQSVTDSDIIFRINSMRTLTESHALECSRNLHIIQLLHTQTFARSLSVWSTFTEVNTVCSFAKKVGNLAVLVTSNQSQLLLQLP